MNRDLTNYRKSYDKKFLEEKDIPETPYLLFSNWFKEVEEAGGVEEANAMTLSTIGLDGYPKSRIVLLKQFDANGFIFYSNYESEKAKAIRANEHACISFFWPNLERQVIMKGNVEKVPEDISSKYFQSRPRGSQLGAWASYQSQKIVGREVLENRLKSLELEYKNKNIPKPPFWGGYIVKPIEFEFWQGRPNRLHDRICYKSDMKGEWDINRLSP